MMTSVAESSPPRPPPTLSSLRVLWATTLLAPAGIYPLAIWYWAQVAEGVAEGRPWVAWNEVPPWGAWTLAMILSAGSLAIPRALHRRALVRLQARVGRVVDPSRPSLYRDAPRLLPELSDAVVRAAFSRYAARLGLSFGLLAAVNLLALQVLMHPTWASGLGFFRRYHWRPVDYLPMVVLATVLVAVQFPTRRRVLGGLAG